MKQNNNNYHLIELDENKKNNLNKGRGGIKAVLTDLNISIKEEDIFEVEL